MAKSIQGVNANPLSKIWRSGAFPGRALTHRQIPALLMMPDVEEIFLGLIIISGALETFVWLRGLLVQIQGTSAILHPIVSFLGINNYTNLAIKLKNRPSFLQ